MQHQALLVYDILLDIFAYVDRKKILAALAHGNMQSLLRASDGFAVGRDRWLRATVGLRNEATSTGIS